LNLPFKAKLFMTDRCRPYGRICFVLLVFLFLPGLTGAKAQTHPDVKDSSISPAARGDFYFSQGKFKESLAVYKTIVQEGTDSSPIFRNMVRAWDAMASLDEAEKYLSEYRRSHENSSAVWYALGYLHYLKNDEQDAETFFKKAIALDPKNSLAWNNWAALLAKGKHFQEAVKKVQTAIKTSPRELMFYINLKKIYEEMGEGQRFELEYKEVLQDDTIGLAWGYGKTLAQSLRQQAFRAYSKNDIPGAISGFEKILALYREIGDLAGQVPALFSLGLLHEEIGDAQKGHEYFRQVLSINPGHIQAREKIKPLN
jgi:tetratricopeptide (TPR) repeat protein